MGTSNRGVAVIGSILAARTGGSSAGAAADAALSAAPSALGYQAALLAAAGFLALAWGLALTLREADTAGVLARRPQPPAPSAAPGASPAASVAAATPSRPPAST